MQSKNILRSLLYYHIRLIRLPTFLRFLTRFESSLPVTIDRTFLLWAVASHRRSLSFCSVRLPRRRRLVVMSLPLVKSTSLDALGPKIHTPKATTEDDLPHPVKPTEQQSVRTRREGECATTKRRVRDRGKRTSDTRAKRGTQGAPAWLLPIVVALACLAHARPEFRVNSFLALTVVRRLVLPQAEPGVLGVGRQHQGGHVRRGPDPAQSSVSRPPALEGVRAEHFGWSRRPFCAHTDGRHCRFSSVPSELAAEITRDYAGRKILCVGLLSGCFVFLSDLLRHVLTPYEVDFMVVSSYGHGTESTGSVKLKKDMSIDPKGRDVLIIEDLIDTGNTLAWIVSHLKTKGCASVRLCTLLDKASRRKAQVQIDYCGFECPDEVRRPGGRAACAYCERVRPV